MYIVHVTLIDVLHVYELWFVWVCKLLCHIEGGR